MTANAFIRPPLPVPTLSVSRDLVGRRTVLHVAGEVDVATAPMLAEAIEAAVAAGAAELWVDLTATGFMDSSGLHALVGAHQRLRELNRRLAVICPDGCVRRLFDMAGVSRLLRIHESRAAAHREA